MAMTTLNTRILLRGDTAANWATSTLVLLKNEMAIESDTRKIKIGDGVNTFSGLKYINLTPEEINTLITALNESKHTHKNKAVLDATTASFTTSLLTKLNDIEAGAQVNQNAFSKFVIGDATIEADSPIDTVTLVGSNVTITPDVNNDKITFTVADGTTSAKGLVQLTDSTSSTSTTTAATPKSVKSAYDLANTAKTNAATAQSTADSKVGSVSLASGTNNGTLKLTVDGTATDNIAVKGLGSAAYTNTSAYATAAQGTKADNAMPTGGGKFTGAVTLNADPTTALGAATKQYVDSQITSKIAASDAMVFKGTLGSNGTITAVPTTGVVKGDTYKIITAGTWAGSTCKVGDLLIALATGSIEANTTNWAYVPSGDEATTSIKYSTTTQNLTTSAQTGAITLAEGATKQVDTSISAGSTSTKLPTSAAVASFVEGKGYTTKAFKNFAVDSTTISADSNADTLTFAAGSNVTLTPDADNDKITIAAKDTTYSAGSGLTLLGTQFKHSNSVTAGIAQGDADKTLAFGGTFTIPTVSYDATGHVTGKGTTTMTMPATPTTVSGNAGSATKLKDARTIDGVSFNGTSNITHYGICSTASSTVNKVVDLTGFSLTTGARIMVKFTVTNTASSPTLNVNSTGAKAIMYRGAAISAGYLAANRVYEFVYDGTNYEFIGDINVDTNTDTKVTNTLNTTTKAYITGTTSDTTNTGTQVFDTGVYLDTVAGQLTANTFKGSLSGNASTATKLQASKTIRTDLSSTASASFDGTANVTPGITGTLPIKHGGTGQTTAKDSANVLISNLETESTTPVDTTKIVTQGVGTSTESYRLRPISALWDYVKNKIDSVLGLTAAHYKGNAATATTATTAQTLSTTRTIGLGTAVMSTAQEFNGSQDITIPITAVNTDYLINGLNTLILDCGGASNEEASALAYWYDESEDTLTMSTQGTESSGDVNLDLSSTVQVTDDDNGNVTLSY